MPSYQRTETIGELTRAARLARRLRKKGELAGEEPLPPRPQTRADCQNGERPCPWVGCRHHLFLEVTRAGSIKYPAGPDLERLFEMRHTCSLDVAEETLANSDSRNSIHGIKKQMASDMALPYELVRAAYLSGLRAFQEDFAED